MVRVTLPRFAAFFVHFDKLIRQPPGPLWGGGGRQKGTISPFFTVFLKDSFPNSERPGSNSEMINCKILVCYSFNEKVVFRFADEDSRPSSGENRQYWSTQPNILSYATMHE